MEELDLLENSLNLEDLDPLRGCPFGTEADENVPIQAPKKQNKKRTPTPKQLEVLEKAREKMIMNAREKRIKKQLEDEAIEKEIQRRVNEYKKGVEEKIVRKAIAIKKREIIRQAEIDEIEDDDIPMEKVVEAVKKPKPKQQSKPEPVEIQSPQPPQAKKYIFV